MKMAAHPLVVAVALGLIDPGALTTFDDDEDAPCVGCEEETTGTLETDEAELRGLLGELQEIKLHRD